MKRIIFLLIRLFSYIFSKYGFPGKSLFEQGYPYKTVKIYRVSNQNHLFIDSNNLVLTSLSTALHNIGLSSIKKDTYLICARVSCHYIRESSCNNYFYYIGPKTLGFIFIKNGKKRN